MGFKILSSLKLRHQDNKEVFKKTLKTTSYNN